MQRRLVDRRRRAACANKDGWIYGGSQVNGFFGAGPNSPETGDYAETHQKVQQVKYTAPATNKPAARSRLRHLHLAVGIPGAARAI